MSKISSLALGLIAIGFGLVQPAKADNLQIQCTSPTVCASGGIQTTQNGNPTFNIVSTNGSTVVAGTLWLAVLVPTGSTFSVGSTILVNGNISDKGVAFNTFSPSMWSVLGESVGPDHNFSTMSSFFTQFHLGSQAPPQYTVYDILIGSVAANTPINHSVSFSRGFPQGTEFVAFTENSSGNVALWSPNSESLMVVPEPASLILLGSGLVCLFGWRRRFPKS